MRPTAVLQEGFSEAAAVQAKKDLKFAVDRIQGIPQEEFSMLNKSMEHWRDFNVNDLASMVPLMGTTLGKTVFQFMNFSIHGWNKSMLFAMNHRDFSTLSTVMHGSFFASLAYIGRTQMSAMGMDEAQRDEFLAKRMAPKQIVANSFGRIAQPPSGARDGDLGDPRAHPGASGANHPGAPRVAPDGRPEGAVP